MFEFLSYDGYLIQELFPNITLANVILANRMGKLIQFFAALVIVIDLLGTTRVNEILDLASLPFVKLFHAGTKAFALMFLDRLPTESPPPDASDEFPLWWVLPLYTGLALLVWWLFSERPLAYWLAYPFLRLGRSFLVFRELSISPWLPLMVLWVLIKFVGLYMFAGLLLFLCVVYPLLGIVILVGKSAEYVSRAVFSETLFRAVFFFIFAAGFFLEFLTAR